MCNRNLLLQEGLIGGWKVPESMDQGGVTLSTDERVRQAVERRRNAQQQKGGTSTGSHAGNGDEEGGPANGKRRAAATDGASRSITAETGGSAAIDRAEGFDPVGGASGYERQSATEAEQLLERLPGDFERIKADEARRRQMALEARGASPPQVRGEGNGLLAKKPRYLNAPAAVAQREALARDREEAQRQFQKQPVPGPRAASTTGASTVPATATAAAVGSSAWFARRAASMASLNALVAPTSLDGASQSRRSSRGSVSIGRRRIRNRVGTDAAAPADTSSNGAAVYDTMVSFNGGTRPRIATQQDSGVRTLYEKRQSSQENRRDSGNDRSSSSSGAGRMLSRRQSDHETYGGSDEEDQAVPWGERSFAAEKHWRPVLQIRQQQRKAKALLSVLEESGWSLSACQRNCDKETAAVVVAHWHAAGMGGRSLVPPPAATLPWPVSSTAAIGVEGHASAAALGGANPLLRTKIPRVPKKTKEQREMERQAEQQAQVVREKEDQQKAREKHLVLEQQRSQHRQDSVLPGDCTSRNPGSTAGRPSDGAEAGGASANIMAAEAFLTRMQYTPLGDALVSRDKIETRRDTERGRERKQPQKDSVTVKGHAIDALSAVVKPVLKRYYKSKAITSADDFKHLCAIYRKSIRLFR